MAEGLTRAFHSDKARVQSAGSFPSGVHPLAVEALDELGIDIANAESKSVDSIDPDTVDTVITLCAEEVCPAFLGDAERLDWALSNPGGDPDSYRQVRDEIRKRLTELLGPETITS